MGLLLAPILALWGFIASGYVSFWLTGTHQHGWVVFLSLVAIWVVFRRLRSPDSAPKGAPEEDEGSP